MPTLAERVQALPAEIYNEIFALTFTPSSGVIVNKDYKPPPSMQVKSSQFTRTFVYPCDIAGQVDVRFAKYSPGENFQNSYFDDTIFYVEESVMKKWINTFGEATMDINSENRVTGFLFRTNSLNLWKLVLLYLDKAWGVATDLSNLLSFQIAFGEPEQRACLPYCDLAPDFGTMPPHVFGLTATEWCEKKFGNQAQEAAVSMRGYGADFPVEKETSRCQ